MRKTVTVGIFTAAAIALKRAPSPSSSCSASRIRNVFTTTLIIRLCLSCPEYRYPQGPRRSQESRVPDVSRFHNVEYTLSNSLTAPDACDIVRPGWRLDRREGRIR